MARARLRAAAAQAGFSGSSLDDFEVATGEALSNAILHGSPTSGNRISICIAYNARNREFSVEITDQGAGFDAAVVSRSPQKDDMSGRGLKLIAALVDKAVLFHDGTGTTVRLSKKIADRG
jgi:anti-sigma regulatory factor (Ser/Thr protein kinase)